MLGGFRRGCLCYVCFGTSSRQTGAGQVERVGGLVGGSCLDVSIDVLVLGEAGLVR